MRVTTGIVASTAGLMIVLMSGTPAWLHVFKYSRLERKSLLH